MYEKACPHCWQIWFLWPSWTTRRCRFLAEIAQIGKKLQKFMLSWFHEKKTDIFSLYINQISIFRQFVNLISRKILEILEFCKFAMQNPEIKQYCCHQCHFFEIFSFLLFELLKKLLWIRFQVIFQESSSPPTGQSRAVVIPNMIENWLFL